MIFYKADANIPDPQIATKQLDGEIPVRAFQFCEPFLAANRAGFLLSPPMNFDAVWSGTDLLVQPEGLEEWLKVDTLFLPNFSDSWTSHAPAEAISAMPPFLEVFPERGVVQVWTGFFCATRPKQSTWVRAPINRTPSPVYQVLEGIIETDWWGGPLFTNFQFLRSDDPVKFRTTSPWLQVIEVPSEMSKTEGSDVHCKTQSVAEFDNTVWERIIQTSERRNSKPPGSYRKICRKSS